MSRISATEARREVAGTEARRRDGAISASDAERPTGLGAAIVLLGFVPLLYATMLLDDATFSWLVREERPIELLGAFSLLAAAIACLALWRDVRGDQRWPVLRHLGLLALAALFVFGFGEEISWGQRILGFGTPESLQASNLQDETTVHNLSLFGGLLDMDGLFQLFWLVLGVVIPVAALWRAPRRRLQRLVPILPVALAAIFVLNQVLTRSFHALFTSDPGLYNSTRFSFNHGIYEIKETVSCLVLATGFWLLYLHRRAQRRARTEPPLQTPLATPAP